MWEQWKEMLNLPKVLSKTAEPASLMWDMFAEGVNVDNAKSFKDRIRERGTGVGAVDAITGPGSDLVRFILKSTFTAATFVSDTKRGNEKKTSYLRTNALKSLFLGKLGLSPYSFDNKEGPIRRENALSFAAQRFVITNMKNGHLDASPEGNASKQLFWLKDHANPSNHLFKDNQYKVAS